MGSLQGDHHRCEGSLALVWNIPSQNVNQQLGFHSALNCAKHKYCNGKSFENLARMLSTSFSSGEDQRQKWDLQELRLQRVVLGV